MRFGICGLIEQAPAFKSAGADFFEGQVQLLTQPLVTDDAQWNKPDSPLPILAANVLLPGTHRVTGPDVDPPKLKSYLERVMSRAGEIGIDRIVFGSGGARKIPDGFPRQTAWQQIIDFAKQCAYAAQKHNIVVVAEPLNRGESNVMNSVGECAEIVMAVDHPCFRLLVDSYHFWLENDSLEDLKRLMPMIEHVHVADKDGRVFPGESGKSDYQPFFTVIKSAGYSGLISIEAISPDPVSVAARSLDFLRKQWAAA